jgi:hypothetical protein
MRAGLVFLASVYLLTSCASLPQAPPGPLPENASQSIREYKLRKHRVALHSPIGGGVWFKVSNDYLDFRELETYFIHQGEIQLGQEIAETGRRYRRGMTWTYVGAIGLAPVTFGLSLLLPMAVGTHVENKAWTSSTAVIKSYNDGLEARYFAPPLPLVPDHGVKP